MNTRDFLRGRAYGDQPVFSRYAVGGGPGWVDSAHEPLGLEDLDDAPLVAVPTGGANQATAVGGGKVSVLPAGSMLSTLAGMFPGVKASIPATPASTPTSTGGAIAKTVSADGSVNGDKGFYAEIVNPEHPQYDAAKTGLATSSPEEVQKFAQNVREGIQQAVTGQTATNWLGSILGAGIGGPGLGTGALPGILGQRAQELFGAAGLPAAAIWTQSGLRPTDYATNPAWMSLATDVDRVGRQTVSSLLGATQPQLDGIRRLLEHRATQVQATAEHDRLMQLERYQREVLALLQHIAIRTGARTPLDFAINNFATNTGGGQWRRY